MLETQNQMTETARQSDVNTVIDNTYDWLFNFNYPCSELTESEKRSLEKHFCMHFYTREIGFETFGLFKLKLQSKLMDIMPKYNKLYALEHMNLDFFADVDYYKKLDGTVEQDGTTNKRSGYIDHRNSGKETTTTSGSYSDQNSGTNTDVKTGKVKNTSGGTNTHATSGSYKDTDSGADITLFSDTPQGQIDITPSAAYVTTVTKNNKGGSTERTFTNYQDTDTAGQWNETEFQNETNTNTDQRKTTRTFDNYKVENENNKVLRDFYENLLDEIDKTDTTHNLERVYGNMGNNLDKFIKYRDNVMNLELMIIDECKDLFMSLWI